MRRETIDVLIPGWSGQKQWDFFTGALCTLPNNARVLMLGVYMGRDIAYLHTLAENMGKTLDLVGVDLFQDIPGKDWGTELDGKTWQEAHGVLPPQQEVAMANVPYATLFQMDAYNFLRGSLDKWDMIYIDLSHDYDTTHDTITGAIPLLKPGGILAGDDYSDEGTWGVKRAVTELLPDHKVFADWIWHWSKP